MTDMGCFARELLVRFVHSEKDVKVKCRTEDHADALTLALLDAIGSGPAFFGSIQGRRIIGGYRTLKIESTSYGDKQICLKFSEIPHKMRLFWPDEPPPQGRTAKLVIEDELIDFDNLRTDIRKTINKHLHTLMKKDLGPNEFFVSGSFVMSLDDDDDEHEE